ncbi:helix-turn-helix domain-containing protein [Saccharothrix hoggarensis]|uniref:Scr1 family TA system antitoxin-like transcriptional regulator n=1 Tax=Saccharothrix hoggarensis TaxID=913853 RepID=A0ABW3QHD2_9PSEU
MSVPVSPTRQLLGRALREARTAAGLSQHAVATILDCSQGKINKLESGVVVVKDTDLRLLVKHLGIDEATATRMVDLLDMVRRERGWSGRHALIPPFFRRYQQSEQHAVHVRGWHAEAIPGLLQSERNMLTLLSVAGPDALDDQVRNREERRQVFTANPDAQHHYILGEGAFHRIRSSRGPGVALDQVEHLLRTLDRHPQLAVQVLTYATNFVPGDFSIVTMPEGLDDFVYLERVNNADYLTKEKDLLAHDHAWSRLAEQALSLEESRRHLETLRNHLCDESSD